MAEAGDFRSDIRDALLARKDKLLEVIDACLDAEKVYWCECRKCGTKTGMTFPDLRAALDAAKYMTEQGIGKTADAPPPEVIRWEEIDLDEASDDELRELIAKLELAEATPSDEGARAA